MVFSLPGKLLMREGRENSSLSCPCFLLFYQRPSTQIYTPVGSLGLACRIRLKPTLCQPLRNPRLQEGAGQAEGPRQCSRGRGRMQEAGQPERDCRRALGCVLLISLSPIWPDPSSKLTNLSEHLPPGGSTHHSD